MKNLAISRRYAKALLLIGKEDGNAEVYRKELDQLAGLVTKEKSLEQALTNPLYNAAARKKVLQLVIEKLSLSKATRSFLFLLFDKGRIGFLVTINEFY
ncbi:MAG: F-type H+-transporting ATPase subunit delta, partial [Thermodesulfobacteriota bacterium]|nr:F-type H+-transporting ATPase subunit delta [Thermodesulfobacteriota bacterium]